MPCRSLAFGSYFTQASHTVPYVVVSSSGCDTTPSLVVPGSCGWRKLITKYAVTGQTVGDCVHAQAQSSDRETGQECSGHRNLRALQSAVPGGASAGWPASTGAGGHPAAVQLAQVQACARACWPAG